MKEKKQGAGNDGIQYRRVSNGRLALAMMHGALIASACMSVVGYVDTMPQPTDPKTMPIVIAGAFLVYAVPIIGWVLTLIALKNTPITKDHMIEVQKKIANLKEEDQ